MTALAPTFGPAQDVKIFAGADFAIDIIIEDDAGNPIDLTGRVFAMVVFDPSTEEPVLQRSATATGTSCPLAFTGDETRDLRIVKCARVLRLQVMEVFETGTDIMTDGIVSILPSPSGVNAAPASSSSAAPVQIVRTGDRRQVVFRYQGAPGEGAAQQLGFDSPAAMQAALIDAPVDAAVAQVTTALTELDAVKEDTVAATAGAVTATVGAQAVIDGGAFVIGAADRVAVDAGAVSTAANQILPLTSTIISLPAILTTDASGATRPLQPTRMNYPNVITQGVWLDTLELYDPVNDPSAAIALAKEYIYLPPFSDGDDILYASMLIAGTGQVPSGYSAVTGMPFTAGASASAAYDLTEIIIVAASPTNLNIYRKGSNPDSNRYIRHNFYRFTDNSPTVQADVWRLGPQYECERTGEFTFTDIRIIGNDAETDVAIWVYSGAASDGAGLVGGKEHGGEKITAGKTPAAFVDDVPYDFSTPRRARKFELFQHTTLWKWDGTVSGTPPSTTFTKTGLSSTVVATIQKRHTFTSAGYAMAPVLTWQASLRVRKTYFGMGVVYRTNPAGEQISSTAYLPDDWAPVDLSVGAYADLLGKWGDAKLTGPTGITFTWHDPLPIDRYSSLATTGFRDVSNRNKFYPDYSGDMTTTAGAVWALANEQSVSTTN